ncbi:unnamed protein product [Orchesella dallaii]|uniref:Platelet-derived growth factor (PDGF) family profile domain-containing protein n=1 Tax=Orchesella dallaii TaxID=48710 RepID=A0ABP1RKH8_9HEXA
MRESLLLTFVVVLCYITASNQQQPTGAAVPARRSINIGEKTKNDFSSSDDDDSKNADIVFDNSPDILKFPTESPPIPSTSPRTVTNVRAQSDRSRWKKIPLRKLVELGNEASISTFLNKYLANAKVHKDLKTNEEYLIDKNGATIINSNNKTVIVAPGYDPQTAPGSLPALNGARARSGTQDIAARLNNIADQGPTKMKAKLDAVCTPEMTTIPVPITVDPFILALPRCLRVARCGGCCLSEVMACEPDHIQKKEFFIKKIAYTGDTERPYEYVDDERVEVDSHTSCKCQCRTKKEHCNDKLHDYVENECSCVCKKKSDYEECQTNSMKVWDNVNCLCSCRQERPCSSGYYFNLNTCECDKEKTEVRRKKKKRDATITKSSTQ